MSTASRPLPDSRPCGAPSVALCSPNSQPYGLRSVTWPDSRPSKWRGWFPQAAGRFAAALAGLDAVPGRVHSQALVGLLPDVIAVVPLAQGRDNGQVNLAARGPRATELSMVIGWCMGVMRLRVINQ